MGIDALPAQGGGVIALFSTPRPGIGTGFGPAFNPDTFGVAGAQAQAFATPQTEPPPEPAPYVPPPDYSADLAAQAQAFAEPDFVPDQGAAYGYGTRDGLPLWFNQGESYFSRPDPGLRDQSYVTSQGPLQYNDPPFGWNDPYLNPYRRTPFEFGSTADRIRAAEEALGRLGIDPFLAQLAPINLQQSGAGPGGYYVPPDNRTPSSGLVTNRFGNVEIGSSNMGGPDWQNMLIPHEQMHGLEQAMTPEEAMEYRGLLEAFPRPSSFPQRHHPDSLIPFWDNYIMGAGDDSQRPIAPPPPEMIDFFNRVIARIRSEGPQATGFVDRVFPQPENAGSALAQVEGTPIPTPTTRSRGRGDYPASAPNFWDYQGGPPEFTPGPTPFTRFMEGVRGRAGDIAEPIGGTAGRGAFSLFTGPLGIAANVADLAGVNVPYLSDAGQAAEDVGGTAARFGAELAVPVTPEDFALSVPAGIGAFGRGLRAGETPLRALGRGALEAFAFDPSNPSAAGPIGRAFAPAVTPEPTVLRVAAQPAALADLPPDSLAAALGSKTIADPAGVRILGPGEAPLPGEVEMFHGTASTGIDTLRPGTFVTPDVRQAQSYARSAVALETRPAGIGRRILAEERGSIRLGGMSPEEEAGINARSAATLRGGTLEPTPATAGMRESIEALQAEQAGRAAAKGAGDLQPGGVEAPDLVKELQRRIGETPASEPRPRTQLEEDLQKVIRGTDTDLSGAPRNYDVSDEALIQNLQEGIAVQDAMGVRELPWSVLHRYERDPITVQKGGLESAIRNLGGTPIQGRKPELAAQLRALWEDSLRGAVDRIRVAREALAESAPDLVPSSALQRMEEASGARRAEWLASGGGTPEIWDDLLGVSRGAAVPPSPPSGTVPPRLGGTPATPPPGGATPPPPSAGGTPPTGTVYGPQSVVDRALDQWRADTRSPELQRKSNVVAQNHLKQGLHLLSSAISGEFRNPIVQFMHERRTAAEVMLQAAGLNEKQATKLANDWVKAETDRFFGGSNAASRNVLDILANNDARAAQGYKNFEAALTASQRIKNTMFGTTDFGIFGVQMLAAIENGLVPLGVGVMNRTPVLKQVVNGVLNVMHAPGSGNVYRHAISGADNLRYSAGARAHRLDQGGVRPEAGTIISMIPGKISKSVDRIPTAISEKITRAQFDGIMGPINKLIFEGNMWIGDRLGVNIANPATVRTYQRDADAITSAAKTAATANRGIAENALFLTAQMTRAQINRVLEMSKLIRPDATRAERQVAATMIVSKIVTIGIAGTVINEAIGVDDFEMNPFSPDFGWITTKWKDNDGRNIRVNLMSQTSTEKALATTVEAALNELGVDANGQANENADWKDAKNGWVRYAASRANPSLSNTLRLAGGLGYGEGGQFYTNPTAPWDTGYGMSMADRIQQSLPLPLNTRRIAPNIGESVVAAAKGETIPSPTEGGSPILSPEVGIETIGLSEYGESAFSELDRRFPEAMQILGNREAHPPILKQAWANVTDYDQLGNREKRDVQAALGPDFAKRFDEDVAGMRRSEERDATDQYFKIAGSNLPYEKRKQLQADYLNELDAYDTKLGAAVRENLRPKNEVQEAINKYYEVPFAKREAYLDAIWRYDPKIAARVWYNVREEK